MCLCILILVYLGWPLKQSSKLCISYSLDEHLNAQLRKWVLWLLFVMSKIKIVSYISYSYHSFWREGLEKNKWAFLLSLICPGILCSKRKYAKKNKSKKTQNAFNMIASVFPGDVGVIGCTSKVIVSIK